MEKNSTTRHVAIVEKCVMTEMAWRYIFSREDNRRYHIHLFKNVSMLRAGNDSNLLIVFYVQIMPDDFVMQLHR
ncbi:hypothetical protein SNM59_19715, partial [Klebsiella pneumoniae]|nr:hypothetical protein [Klebsiella pneumoniae]